jgi:hypothetical protein
MGHAVLEARDHRIGIAWGIADVIVVAIDPLLVGVAIAVAGGHSRRTGG